MVKVQFSVDDLRSPEGLERVLRQFQNEFIVAAAGPPLDLEKLIPAIRNQLQATGRFPLNTTSLLGTTAVVTSFSDSFDRADTTKGLGQNWVANQDPATPTAQTYKILSNQLKWGSTGGGSGNGYMVIPWSVYNNLYGLSQFAQATFVSGTGVTSSGPAVMFTPDMVTDAKAYALLALPGVPEFGLYRLSGGGTTLTQFLGPFTLANGDILKLSVFPTAANNVIHVFKNGAEVTGSPTTDTNAARAVQTGAPVMYLRFGGGAGASVLWDSYSCGAA